MSMAVPTFVETYRSLIQSPNYGVRFYSGMALANYGKDVDLSLQKMMEAVAIGNASRRRNQASHRSGERVIRCVSGAGDQGIAQDGYLQQSRHQRFCDRESCRTWERMPNRRCPPSQHHCAINEFTFHNRTGFAPKRFRKSLILQWTDCGSTR